MSSDSKFTRGEWRIRRDENQIFIATDYETSAPLWAGDGPNAKCSRVKDVAIVCKYAMAPGEREAFRVVSFQESELQ